MSATMDSREYRELQAEYRALRALNAELLEALEHCVDRAINMDPFTLQEAQSAIAKARN